MSRRSPARRRAGALALGAVAAGTLLLGPAGAALAGPPSVTISSPSSGGIVTSHGFVVSGSVSASTSGGTITGPLQVTVTNLAGHPGYSASLPDGWCGSSSCQYAVQVPELSWNGGYSVAVAATETDPNLSTTPGSHPVTVTSSFSQDTPPPAPRSFTAAPSSDGRSVSLSWAADTQPDLLGYQISRSPASPGSWPAAVTGTGFVDDSVQPGTAYSYTVEAVRSGASSNSAPAYSPPSGASASTPAPPPPAGPAGASGSSGSTGGSGSGGTSAASGGSSASGSYFRTQPTGSAPSSQPEAAASLSQFQSLLSRTRSDTAAAPALAAPSLPPIPEDGVGQPGADNPTVAPFSSGDGGPQGGTRSALVTYDNGGGGPSRFQSAAAVALAALLVAIAAHLLWLRRQISRPAPPG